MDHLTAKNCPLCRKHLKLWRTISKKPDRETSFKSLELYPRRILICPSCIFFASEARVPEGFYEGMYVQETYGLQLRKKFEQIMALKPEESDNVGRINWLTEKIFEFDEEKRKQVDFRVLDVGSGLGIFPASLKAKTQWRVFALDPDPMACRHLSSIGLEVTMSTLEQFSPGHKFDLVTLNKVLEHVEQVDSFLAKAKSLVSPEGLIYVEVPDCEAASLDTELGEEFFIEHIWGFSETALTLLAKKIDLRIVDIKSVLEPSGKRTLRGLFAPKRAAS